MLDSPLSSTALFSFAILVEGWYRGGAEQYRRPQGEGNGWSK